MADSHTLKAVGIDDIHIELPDSLKHTKALLRDVIYAPDMAFTLISISWLDKVKCSVIFSKGMCMIKNLQGWANASDHVNVVAGKMSISKV